MRREGPSEPFRSREKGMLKFSMVESRGYGMIVEIPPNENHENEIGFNGLNDIKISKIEAGLVISSRSSSIPSGSITMSMKVSCKVAEDDQLLKSNPYITFVQPQNRNFKTSLHP